LYHTFASILVVKKTYNQLAAFFILAAFFAQTMNGNLIVLDYYTHTDKYAKDCINKDKPAMHCNGKCQMMKKLKAEEKKDQENPERRGENKNEITLSSRSFFPSITTPGYKIINFAITTPYSAGNTIDRSFDIFHPPQAC
jgi:hypothetical protein